jgi:hypothetical protein
MDGSRSRIICTAVDLKASQNKQRKISKKRKRAAQQDGAYKCIWVAAEI